MEILWWIFRKRLYWPLLGYRATHLVKSSFRASRSFFMRAPYLMYIVESSMILVSFVTVFFGPIYYSFSCPFVGPRFPQLKTLDNTAGTAFFSPATLASTIPIFSSSCLPNIYSLWFFRNDFVASLPANAFITAKGWSSALPFLRIEIINLSHLSALLDAHAGIC